MKPESPRQVARSKGLPTYFTGKPCLRGHVCHRHTETSECVQCKNDRSKQRYENLVKDESKRKQLFTRSNTNQRKQYKKNKRSFQNRRLKQTYGITIDDYDAMAAHQNYCCAICGKHVSMLVNGKKSPLEVDHDHKTNVVRGLLCKDCNKGLGLFYDSIENFENAIAYLRKEQEDTSVVSSHPVPIADEC